MNVDNPEIFAEAQDEILTEAYGTSGHAYPMIAFGTCKKKAAFKLYARSQNLDFGIANEISRQIDRYEEEYKLAEDDEKDEINIYDYVDEKYHGYIKASQKYCGIIMDKKKAPCGYLLYSGDIRSEIGLIKCKSESAKKEYITAVIDGAVAEKYKFLKNDLLKVDVVMLIDKIYKRIGIKQHTVNELDKIVKDNPRIWDIYAKGYTIGVNQVEKASTAKKVMRYKPTNVSELCAFIAAIRPGFKSMYPKFESREHFEYGIKVFDELIQTPQFKESFMLYQEMQMNTLHFAGFPMDECYGIIKAIAKKHPEKVKPLKQKFIDGFKKRIISEEGISEEEAFEKSNQIWQIISDSCRYSFNASHSLCMAYDSLYCAYLKAYYPYEFYEVLLEEYSQKGKKDKVALLKGEMFRAFGIKEGEYKYGLDNRKFIADKEIHCITPSLLSIKNLSQSSADGIYEFSRQKVYDNFYDMIKDLAAAKILNTAQLKILIEIDYFKDFGSILKIQEFMTGFNLLYGKSQFSKTKIPAEYLDIIRSHSNETLKQYNKFDYDSALKELWSNIPDRKTPISVKLKYEQEHLGHIQTTYPKLSHDYVFVSEYECKFKNPKITVYHLDDNTKEILKIKKDVFDKSPISEGNIIRIVQTKDEGRWINQGTDENGKINWVQDNDNKETILKKWSIVR